MFKVIYDGSTEKILHKEVFAQSISSLAEEDKDVIYLDADLTNSSGTYKLWQNNPERAYNCGISEANMMGVAAGLALMGKKPYVHTFGPFASRRCFDQVFISQAYARNCVRIFGSDAGVTAAFNGATHMPFEDMALYRSIPNAIVFDIADAVQFKFLLKAVKDIKDKVVYFRSTRKSYKAIYSDDSTFEIGKANVLTSGNDLSIIACGLMVGEAMKAAENLKKEGINVKVIDMFTVKPIDKEVLLKAVVDTRALVVSENHNVIGGLNDAVSESLRSMNLEIITALGGKSFVHIQHGIEERFGAVGPQDYLQNEYSLTAEMIVAKAKQALKLKKLF